MSTQTVLREILPPPPPAPAAASSPGPDEAIVQRHARGVFRFLRVLGAPASIADDLVQEAFVVAWQKGKQELPAAALGAFLRRTARFLWLEQNRDVRREAAALAMAAERAWQQECAADDGDAYVARVASCLARLPLRARTAFERVYGEEQDRAAVAQALGLLPNGLKMLLQRARRLLLECLRKNP